MWKGGYDKKKADSEYGKKNRKRIMARQKLWNDKNREKVRKWGNIWAKKNPEKRAITWNRRRTIEIGSGGKITAKEWEEIRESQGHICIGCGEKIKLTMDHKIPVSRWIEWAEENKPEYQCGDKENIQGLCRACNSRKGRAIMRLCTSRT